MTGRPSTFRLEDGDDKLIAQLPDHYQEILGMVGQQYEIAAVLGIAIGTVKSRTHRARAALLALRERAR